MLVQKDAPIKFRIHKVNTGEGDYDLVGRHVQRHAG